MPIRKKNVSASFAVFLNTFLIISTVIVFAVLLFLSYENMYNQAISRGIEQTRKTAAGVASDIGDIYSEYVPVFDNTGVIEDGTEAKTKIDIYLSSALYEDKGDIAVTDIDGNIYSGNYHVLSGERIIDSDAQELIRGAGKDTSILTREMRGRYAIMCSCKIEGTDLYAFVYYTLNTSEVLSEYVSVILFPALISMLAAVALFIGFVDLSVKPVREISKVTSKVSGGDLSVRVPRKFTDDNDMSSMTVSSDIAELARTVNNMIEALENQEKDRNVFISSIAHDIRTPLTSINGFITAMLDGTIPADKNEKYLLMIKQEVDRIRKLIVQMTEASSLSHVDPELMESFNVREMITDTTENLEPQLREKSITLTNDLEGLTKEMSYGDAQQLCRVFMNIVTNAIKFTPENGKINVTAASDDKEKKILISVEDSGPGIEPEKRNRVFESFYKADPSRKQEGFGLGLYICKQILSAHDQTIYVDGSETLGGARFVFTFPYVPEDKK
ncbi:MAG: HAMP domain-containing histidine kinase [Clostridiales bacterium]|nr:HAMP domain-containing histidine kinase [Clostridiales bacterium]